MFLHFGLTSKELFEVSFYMISLRRRMLVKKEKEERKRQRERKFTGSIFKYNFNYYLLNLNV